MFLATEEAEVRITIGPNAKQVKDIVVGRKSVCSVSPSFNGSDTERLFLFNGTKTVTKKCISSN